MLGLQENMHMPLRGFEHYIWVLSPQHGQGRRYKTRSLNNISSIYGYTCAILTIPICLTHLPSLTLYFHLSLSLCVCVCIFPLLSLTTSLYLSISMHMCVSLSHSPSLKTSLHLIYTSLTIPPYITLSLLFPPSPSLVVYHTSPLSLPHNLSLSIYMCVCVSLPHSPLS